MTSYAHKNGIFQYFQKKNREKTWKIQIKDVYLQRESVVRRHNVKGHHIDTDTTITLK